jgi:hypothetical protein
LNRKTKNAAEASLVVFFVKVLLASAAAGSVCFYFAGYLERFFDMRRFAGSLAILAIVTLAGIALLAALLKLLRVPELDAYARRAFAFASRG